MIYLFERIVLKLNKCVVIILRKTRQVRNPKEHIGNQEYFKGKVGFAPNKYGLFSAETKRNLITNSSEYYDLSYEYINENSEDLKIEYGGFNIDYRDTYNSSHQ